MRTFILRALAALMLTLTALATGPASAQTASGVQGPVPTGLPNRLLIGLFEEAGQNWMRDSGVPWDVRYRYFTKGWVDNWGWGQRDGSWGAAFMQESATQNFIAAPVFYQLFGEPGGGEGESLAKLGNATTMRGYFSDFKLLMQRAKEHGRPVLVLIEPDALGLLQQQTNSNPNAYAAVAATGLPELASLPNTVAGWSLAFLQLRKAVGANNVILGMHVSAWASGKDIACCSVTDPLQPEVDKVVNFLKPAGLATNVTGTTYDVLVGDPLDRDADFYKLTRGEDRWWNASDTASISSRSFNRYAEWLRLMNVATGKRWVLWQIPLGNSNHRNVHNDGSARAGYRDNRTEYFFGTLGDPHRRKFANSGVIALLFGAGAGGQSSYQNDLGTDGQPYVRSRAGAFLSSGGLTLPAVGTTLPLPGGGTDGGTAGGTDAGTGGVDGGVDGGTDAGTDGGTSGTTRGYGFESGTEGWTASGGQLRAVSTSTARAYAGTRSLAVPFSGTSGTGMAVVPNASVPRGATVTFRVWIPSGSRLTSIQPFALEGAAGGWRYTGRWTAISNLRTNTWNTITVTLPSTSTTPLYQLGVEFTTSGSWTGTAYIDGISW
ncbi:carbohydrate binding domain-containing protein [Myxococcus sp. RHSTA-1-4]|uniref:carbohydrate binding domain-containing protein n=1 Tax=Myxococcus sp. RHSTA-1-4 TaxID=2874601 RepID=UPI001CBDA56E|nr:carbohydrate binding domain-containing protein [Myxococcus sp. RHSTA-1-4]MBZ4418631.1 carbohydrate binding domain-containing protein [Myxococcus sp. RHSTA-1-4]